MTERADAVGPPQAGSIASRGVPTQKVTLSPASSPTTQRPVLGDRHRPCPSTRTRGSTRGHNARGPDVRRPDLALRNVVELYGEHKHLLRALAEAHHARRGRGRSHAAADPKAHTEQDGVGRFGPSRRAVMSSELRDDPRMASDWGNRSAIGMSAATLGGSPGSGTVGSTVTRANCPGAGVVVGMGQHDGEGTEGEDHGSGGPGEA